MKDSSSRLLQSSTAAAAAASKLHAVFSTVVWRHHHRVSYRMTDECQPSNLFISSVYQFQLLAERVELIFFSPASPSIIGRQRILPHATHKVRLSNYGCKFLFYDIISHHWTDWQLKLLFCCSSVLVWLWSCCCRNKTVENDYHWCVSVVGFTSLICGVKLMLLLLNTGYPAENGSFGAWTLCLTLFRGGILVLKWAIF